MSLLPFFVIPAVFKPESRPAPLHDLCVAGFRLKDCRNDGESVLGQAPSPGIPNGPVAGEGPPDFPS